MKTFLRRARIFFLKKKRAALDREIAWNQHHYHDVMDRLLGARIRVLHQLLEIEAL